VVKRVRNDLDLYERHADEWWDTRSPTFRSLQQVNVFRIGLIETWIGPRLPGARVVDLGCGGGLLAHPLAERGAQVVGIDLSRASLRAASRRPSLEEADGGTVAWSVGDVASAPLASGSADHVLLADVVEHLDEPESAVAEAARLLRPGGTLYVNTLNRTRRAAVLAVHVSEGIGLVPRGTHDPALFVTPDELRAAGEAAGLQLDRLQGESPGLLRTLGTWRVHLRRSRSLAVAYSALFTKLR
jgi:2-polyprenyl-6-hydroxyphenyl methylase/3-demethylubiquinone-9 3-methyltransferase